MIDPKTEGILSTLYPDFARRVRQVYLDVLNAHGRAMRATEGNRSFQRQIELFNSGRFNDGPILTQANAGFTFHHYGVAIDSCWNDRKDPFLENMPDKGEALWKSFGDIAHQNGLIWGGIWEEGKDMPHLEISYNLPIRDVYETFRLGGIHLVWNQFDMLHEGADNWSNQKLFNPEKGDYL